jgi:hypothetical protein
MVAKRRPTGHFHSRLLVAKPRQYDFHHRAPWHGAFQVQAAIVVLHDLLRDRESQSRAILLAMADEGVEQFVADREFYSRTVVDDLNFQVAVLVGYGHANVTTADLRGLTAVQQQVVEDAFHLAGIELRVVQAGRVDGDGDPLKLAMRAHQFDGPADGPSPPASPSH